MANTHSKEANWKKHKHIKLWYVDSRRQYKISFDEHPERNNDLRFDLDLARRDPWYLRNVYQIMNSPNCDARLAKNLRMWTSREFPQMRRWVHTEKDSQYHQPSKVVDRAAKAVGINMQADWDNTIDTLCQRCKRYNCKCDDLDAGYLDVLDMEREVRHEEQRSNFEMLYRKGGDAFWQEWDAPPQ